jgi:caffeoyl-CoA O-methyltransferase
MPDKYTTLSSALYKYLVDHRSEHDPVLAALAKETEALGPVSLMQVAPEQGAFMTLLVRAIGARSAVEVGTFTGYSALCIARGLPEDGRLLCCDVSEEWTAIGRRHWKEAGVAHKIDLRIGPALDTLRALLHDAVFDFAFVDADKSSYLQYYEEILRRLRPNGLILFDNVLWMGQVIEPGNSDDSTLAIRALNDCVAADPRVESVMLPVSDGLTMVRKRAAGEPG